jgi:hypothetical protein
MSRGSRHRPSSGPCRLRSRYRALPAAHAAGAQRAYRATAPVPPLNRGRLRDIFRRPSLHPTLQPLSVWYSYSSTSGCRSGGRICPYMSFCSGPRTRRPASCASLLSPPAALNRYALGRVMTFGRSGPLLSQIRTPCLPSDDRRLVH